MTKDDIIRMAEQAGYGPATADIHSETLERFAALVAKIERKEIEQRVLKSDMNMANKLYVVNALIRARGQS